MGLYKRGSVWWMSFIDPNTGEQERISTETDDLDLAKRIFDSQKGKIADGKWFERLPGQDIKFREFIEKYLALLSHAFTIAIREWEWVSENPVKKVTREEVHNKMERWLTLEEEKRLLGASPAWLWDIITYAIHTGFRLSEILGLRWNQIDMKRRTVTISEQKNQGVDTLPLNETVMNLLTNKMKGRAAGSELVFPSLNGTRISNRNLFRAFRSALDKAKITGFRFHDLRHTFATRLVQNGVDLYAVQKLGRWKNTSMIMRYAHHYPESLRPGIETMDRVEKGNITNLAQSPKKRGHKPYLRLVTP